MVVFDMHGYSDPNTIMPTFLVRPPLMKPSKLGSRIGQIVCMQHGGTSAFPLASINKVQAKCSSWKPVLSPHGGPGINQARKPLWNSHNLHKTLCVAKVGILIWAEIANHI